VLGFECLALLRVAEHGQPHTTGDQVLRAIAGILRANCRSDHDVPVRYAGDEFAVFLHAELPDALDIAERLRTAVRSTDLGYLDLDVPISISTGAAFLEPAMSGKELFHAADENLYRAKRSGRDRVAG